MFLFIIQYWLNDFEYRAVGIFFKKEIYFGK
jgi:hypothetical protein